MSEVIYNISELKETQKLASQLALQAKRGDIFTLKGDLGTGKTAFARYFIQACTQPSQEVPSPTFTLVQLYETAKFPLYHFDLYRLNSSSEVLELGIEEAFFEGVSLIEWPERLGSLRLQNCLSIEFVLNEQRWAVLKPDISWLSRFQSLKK
ncbi:MAG: tRNA (adenosine(37)-N6)-threonylcarbamoyltransferase complex ATPase subunit type 1 TsaE [Alphaproteobacteria bacterium]|nr:tRNA (adenosine(37)-N6)-threonylcarbamoyltransferase complex ATPase subunit type 1 TsaE [Alphaproteobacteria bacterium]